MQCLLKQDTFVSSLKDQPVLKIPVLKKLPAEAQADTENIQDTKRSTQVNTLLKHDTYISSLKEDVALFDKKNQIV